MRFLYFALLAAVAVPTTAQTTAQPSLEAQAAANMARGDLLYAYDQSAWHVTDAALAAIPKSSMNLLRGYVVTPAQGGYRTTFYGGEAGSHFRIYSAIWSSGSIAQPELVASDKRQPVTADEERLIAAKTLALGNLGGLTKCTDARLNSAVIPGATPQGPISVYILTPPTKKDVIPMGGHHRLDIKDGAVVAKRSFTRSCIELEKPRASKKQGKPVAMMITHLLDPVPTEIHAFAVHSVGLPMFVSTVDGALFSVELNSGRAVAKKTGQLKQ